MFKLNAETQRRREKSWKKVFPFLLCVFLPLGSLWFQLNSCQSGADRQIETLAEGMDYFNDKFSSKTATLIFFLSPECPLCENYSLNIRELRKMYPEEEFAFYGVFPGTFYGETDIRRYLKQYEVPVIPLLDPEYHLTHELEASVTPEVFVFDSTGTNVYKGSIDNWIPKLGQKRTVVTKHYLKDALVALNRGEAISVRETKAIGCFIE